MTISAARLMSRDHGLGALLTITYLSALLITSQGLGMSRDESFYYVASESYGRWFKQLYNDPSVALKQEVIDRAWEYNHEHPPLTKTLSALFWLAHEKFRIFPSDSSAFRFTGMLFASLLIWAIFVWGSRQFGRAAGLFAALTYAFLPRPFYHAHLNCMDVPIAAMMFFTTYAYWRSLTPEAPRANETAAEGHFKANKKWIAITGLLFGLSMATKHNSWALPILFSIHFTWVALRELKNRRAGMPPSRSIIPYWLLSCAVIGPLIFWASWPWLWHDGKERFLWYANFHLNHEYYNISYFGVNYFRPPFPTSYAWVMTLFTVPLTTIILCLFGVLTRVRYWTPAWLQRATATLADASLPDVLWLGGLIAPLFIISLPSTPIFGGTKHWFAAYPFMALFAGAGFHAISQTDIFSITTRSRLANRLQTGMLGAFLITPNIIETAHSHRFGLSHYTPLAGGVPGAATKGMNRQFWGFTTGSLTYYFKERLPRGGTVWICDTTFDAWQMLKRDHLLPNDIDATWDLSTADYAIVHHELHFAEVDFQIWQTFGTTKPDFVLTYDGVPIISVYKNPRKTHK